jgi:phosphatidylserine/phosphatidylglycerophosphate/cardiolipin synthase-like enzyme
VEVESRPLPISLHRALGNIPHGGDLNERQAAEELQINHLREGRFDLSQLIESVADLNKFAVIDRQEVWTGSMNYTVNEAYRNNNNLVRISSPQLAENYTNEFEEMFADDQFGPGSPANTPNPDFKTGTTRMQSCFSPDDGCSAQLLKVIQSAKQSISFLAYSFTSDDLAQALIERSKQGVKIEGVMERSQVESNGGSDYDRFRSAGLEVRLDGNPKQMHDKVMIIDDQIVVTGSFNYTYSAEHTNDENLLVIYNPQIAGLYLAEFERIFTQANP